MKRPDGFDPGARHPAPRGTQRSNPKPRRSTTASAPRPERVTPPRPGSVGLPEARPEARPEGAARSRTSAARAQRRIHGASRRETRPDAASRAELRRAARARRRFERAEIRRFTRRARNRRVAFAAVGGLLATLVALVVVAVYSPILALRTITVDGTSRIDSAEVHAAVDGQLGTPLALLDFGTVTRDLAVFPLIRSYVTEIVPPGTLLIHITERAPVGSVKVGAMFNLVDPAGIVLQQSAERIPGVPVLNLPGGDTTGPAFTSMVAVLVALPPELLAQVDSISASTRDDVSLVLSGVGQGVTWGSADDSARKATLLAALIRLTDPAQPGVFDVSAPGNGVFRPS